MASSESVRTVLAWFEAKGPVPGAAEPDKLAVDFFSAGLIDSLAVIELITDLEAKFGIRFMDKHFQQRRFSTIGGLAEIVEELAQAKVGS